MGFKRRPAAQKPLLNEVRARRLDFATRHAGHSATWWRNVIFSNEKIFRVGNNRRALLVTRRSSERLKPGCMNTAPKHALQVHVWGAIGWAGVGPLKLVQGTLNAAAYQQQILTDIRNTCQMLAPRGRAWLFQHDNAPAHNAVSTRNFLAHNHVPKLEWPGNSPDLNPIEHLWALVQRRLPRALPANTNEWWIAVQNAWRAVPFKLVRRLIESMPARIAAVIEANGGTTRY